MINPYHLQLITLLNLLHLYTWIGQIFDLGLQHKYYNDPATIRKHINDLAEKIDLVLIMEYFDESLVLLKRELCWDLDDVVYFKLNQRSLEYKQLELTSQQEVWFKCKPSLRLKSPVALSALVSLRARLKRQTPIRVMTDMSHQNPRIFPYFQFSCSIAVDKVRKQFVFFFFSNTRKISKLREFRHDSVSKEKLCDTFFLKVSFSDTIVILIFGR